MNHSEYFLPCPISSCSSCPPLIIAVFLLLCLSVPLLYSFVSAFLTATFIRDSSVDSAVGRAWVAGAARVN